MGYKDLHICPDRLLIYKKLLKS
ncbi:MAG: hypothetical protein MSC43_05725 [Clostridiales bacterium]|nr:hypothetical protein [Clostridiales bacterium]MDD7433284.1 hypothetical protein [Clostridiales bacterium]MDY3062130.1 hypothetical protein [Eubacteriales bacterium]